MLYLTTRSVVASLLVLLAAACELESPSGAKAYSVTYQIDERFGSEWIQATEKARVEGEFVIVLGSTRSHDHRRIFKLFGDKYGIKVVATPGSGSANVQRLLAERARGRFTADMIMMSSTAANRLRRADALVPLEPLFIHPEVSNRSTGWMHPDHVWLGEPSGYITAFRLVIRSNISDIYFNTENVSQVEIESIRSWQDLLDTSWRGRVVSILDPNARLSTSSWRTPWAVLGKQWFERFIREIEPTLLPEGSQRDLVDGLARGKYDLALFIPKSARVEVERLSAVGMPLGKLTRTLAEGELLELKGAIGVLDRAPHPAAAQVFLNWYLSREGQTAYHTLVESDDPDRSLRIDVPQGKVSDDAWAIVSDNYAGANIRPDPELEIASLEESAAFMRSICAEVGCYGY